MRTAVYDGANILRDYTLRREDGFRVQTQYTKGLGIDSKVGRIDPRDGNRRHFYLGDALGSVNALVVEDEKVRSEQLTNPWGEDLVLKQRVADRYGFTQRERDSESGVMHDRARFYDPKVGRFGERDPLTSRKPRSHYLYAANIPSMRVDPSGERDVPIIVPEESGWITELFVDMYYGAKRTVLAIGSSSAAPFSRAAEIEAIKHHEVIKGVAHFFAYYDSLSFALVEDILKICVNVKLGERKAATLEPYINREIPKLTEHVQQKVSEGVRDAVDHIVKSYILKLVLVRLPVNHLIYSAAARAGSTMRVSGPSATIALTLTQIMGKVQQRTEASDRLRARSEGLWLQLHEFHRSDFIFYFIEGYVEQLEQAIGQALDQHWPILERMIKEAIEEGQQTTRIQEQLRRDRENPPHIIETESATGSRRK